METGTEFERDEGRVGGGGVGSGNGGTREPNEDEWDARVRTNIENA